MVYRLVRLCQHPPTTNRTRLSKPWRQRRENKNKNNVNYQARHPFPRTNIQNKGVNCKMEWNEGNHFQDNGIRIAKGFLWLMQHKHTACSLHRLEQAVKKTFIVSSLIPLTNMGQPYLRNYERLLNPRKALCFC